MATEMTVLENDRPRLAGTYPARDAALYIGATTTQDNQLSVSFRNLHRWIREWFAEQPFGEDAESRSEFLTFRDLVSMRIVAVMRSHGIAPKEIKTTEVELRRAFGWEHPFVMAKLWTSAPDVFTKIGGKLVSPSRHWQLALDFINDFLRPVHGMTFDMWDEAAAWSPHQTVLLDPTVQFGEPCIKGTRISTQVLWKFNQAGDDVGHLAFMYDIPHHQIEDAIAWERRLQRAAS